MATMMILPAAGSRFSSLQTAFLVFYSALCLCHHSAQSLSTPQNHAASSVTSTQRHQTESGTWHFRKEQHPIFYERSVADKESSSASPLLLLNGFGMGSFHQHRFMEALENVQERTSQESTVVYSMDYLGQGRSWPIDCNDGNAESERGLQYSVDTWIEQTVGFIEEHILVEHANTSTVHLAGNSLGGYIAVILAARRPDLVASLILINATPIWGLNLPGWSGALPAPPLPRFVGRQLFDTMRQPDTMRSFLDETYTHREAWDDDDTEESFLAQISAATETPGGHAAFASILWSGPAAGPSFWEQLSSLRTCPVALVFGADDPWCTPAIAQRMLRVVSEGKSGSPAVRYWEIQRAGHCPQHEAPRTTAAVVEKWLASLDESSTVLGAMEIEETWGTTVATERTADTMDIPWWKQLSAQLL